MARVVVTRPIPRRALTQLTAAGHEVHVRAGDLPPTSAELRELVRGADGLLCLLADRIDADLLDAAPSLRAIAVYAVGVDNVDLAAAAARGVAVGNTPDVLTDATADLAMALLLATARHVPAAAASVRDGAWRTWEPTGFLGLELRDARLCVVGAGRIGRATAARAEAFGMTVEFVGRGDDLHAALARAHVVTLHAPLTEATTNLIDAEALGAMPRGGILINTARGGLVDQVALAAALRSGQLAAAGLDVTTPEPLPADDPLLGAPNLLVLPHIGSATHRAREAMADRAVRNLLAGLAGEPMPWPAGG
jgi:glyoxylate reductase